MSPLMSVDGRALIRRQLPFEGVLEFLLPVGVGAEGVARHRLARGVELEQLLGHVAHRLLDARLGLLPRRAAEAIERRARGAGVLLHEIEPLDRDEQLVFAGVAELHELLRLEADVDALEADEETDAVIDVDDEVAGFQIAEVREERSRRRLAPLVDLAFFLEDVGFRPELELRVRAAGSRGSDGRRQPGRRPRARPRRAPSAPRRSRSRRAARSSARRGQPSARRGPSCRRARGRDGSPRPSPARARRTRPPADSAMCTGRIVVGKRERLERGRALEPRRRGVPVDQQRRLGAAARWPFSTASVVARLDLLPELLALRVDFVGLRDEDSGRPCDR